MYTPKPWFVHKVPGNTRLRIGSDTHDVATLGHAGSEEAERANANLIAAAPDMCEALEILTNSTCGDIDDDGYKGCIRIEAKALEHAFRALHKARFSCIQPTADKAKG